MDICSQQALVERECAQFQDQLPCLVKAEYPIDVRIVLKYLHEHLFDTDLQMGKACHTCGIRDGRFRRAFKRHCHQTMHHYCEDKRFLATLRLFGFEEVEIGCIAFGIGYDNYRTFGRAFKRRFGKSPLLVRNKLLEKTHIDLPRLPVDTNPCTVLHE